MPGIVRKNLDSPEETRSFKDGKGKLDLVNLDAAPVGRAILQPGWKWSEHVKPLLDPPTDSCQAAHTGYILSGHLRVRMDDGEEVETGPGDFTIIPPGHDAWVVGDESCVMLDWQGATNYAKG